MFQNISCQAIICITLTEELGQGKLFFKKLFKLFFKK